MNSKAKEAVETLKWYINNEMGGQERQVCLNALNTIGNQPILVVHCRNCKHWAGRNDPPGTVTAIGYCDHPKHQIFPLNADFYCAHGEEIDVKNKHTSHFENPHDQA